MTATATTKPPHESKNRLLDAALHVIRAKGYEAASVDDICAAAGLTKGSFFHHFKGKEDLAVAAAAHFGAMANTVFGSAPYQAESDPLKRVLGYVNFRIGMMRGDIPSFSCLLGTMVQETFETHPAIRAACEQNIGAHARMVAGEIAKAKATHAPDAAWSAESLAYFTQAVIQGAFILAKAKNRPKAGADALRHLHRYIEMLFAAEAPRP